MRLPAASRRVPSALAGYVGRPEALRFCISAARWAGVRRQSRPRAPALIRASDGTDIWESPDLTPRGLVYTPVIAADGKSLLLGVVTLEDKPYTELRGKLELVRLDLASGKVLARIRLESASTGDTAWLDQPSLSSDGRTLIMTYGVSEVLVADTAANRALHHHAVFLSRPTLSADGKQMMGVFLQDIAGFETATGKPLFRLPIGAQTVNSLHLLPDGRHVFTSGGGGHACLWDLKAALPRRADRNDPP